MFFKNKKIDSNKKHDIPKSEVSNFPIEEYNDNRAAFLAALNFYISHFEKIVKSFEEIELEAYMGFSPSMTEIIDSIDHDLDITISIYNKNVNIDMLGNEYRIAHKRVLVSNKLIKESLSSLKEGNEEKNNAKFEQGLKQSLEGIEMGVKVMQERNELTFL